MVTAASASTVVLVREHNRELQVYLLKRNTKSGFFPGSYVFPGGALNSGDQDPDFWQPHIDLSPEELQKTFGPGQDITEIIPYGVAAIRETFEEAGVFLARKRDEETYVSGRTGKQPSEGKQDEGWLLRKVSEEGWKLTFSNLFPWSRWITPESMPKRFDTRFFVSLMPEGQECVPDDHEAVHGLWVSPEKGLQGNIFGQIPLSPPTLVTLHELLKFGTLKSLARAIQSRPWGHPRMPIQIIADKEIVIVQPWDPLYGKPIKIDPEGLSRKVVPAGEPFSRLWLDRGIWRPVRA